MTTVDVESVALPLRSVPPLSGGEAHIWYFQPESLPLPGLGDPSDASATMPQPARRMQQKFLLRLLLGAYLGCPGHEVRLSRTDRGKPVLDRPAAGPEPGFSLSHSRRWTAIAVGPEPLGLDIEELDRPLRARALGRRWFSAAEAECLEQTAEESRPECFLRFWTAREAMIKAVGDTLGSAMGQIELDSNARPRRVPERWPDPDAWHLLQMGRFDQLQVCLAAPGGPVRLREFRLAPPV